MTTGGERESVEAAAPARVRRVLLVVQEVAHFPELLKLAQALMRTGRYRADFIAYTTYEGIVRDEQQCRALGMAMHHGFYLKPLKQCLVDRACNLWTKVRIVCTPQRRPSRAERPAPAERFRSLRSAVGRLGATASEAYDRSVRSLFAVSAAVGRGLWRAVVALFVENVVVQFATLIMLAPLYWVYTSVRASWRLLRPRLSSPLLRAGESFRMTLWLTRRAATTRLPAFAKAIPAAFAALNRGSEAFARHPVRTLRTAAMVVARRLPFGVRHRVRFAQAWLRHPIVNAKSDLRAFARRRLPQPMRHRLRVVQRAIYSAWFGVVAFFEKLGKRIAVGARLAYHVVLRVKFRLVAQLERRLRPPNLPGVLLLYFRRRRHFRALLTHLEIDVVVLAEDNVGHATGIFTRAARRRRIPVVTIPYTIANAREFAESYFDVPEHQMTVFANRVLRRLRPKWVHEHRGRALTRLPTWYCAAQDLLRISPPRPWAFNSGYSDAIVVESRRTVDYYRRAGLKTEPLLPLGAMFDDELAAYSVDAAERRAALYRRLNLPADRPLLLTAIPPNQLPSRPNCGFADFDALVRAWLEPLAAQSKFNVVVRLHPRTSRASLGWIETELGLKLCDDGTAQLVPLCDLYVASVSATIRWALACGKPVVNYDVYDYRYDDYDDAAGLAAVQRPETYAEVVRRLATDEAWFRELSAKQRADAVRWGVLDGGAAVRIVRLFDQLTQPEGADIRENGHHRHGAHGPAAFAGGARQAA